MSFLIAIIVWLFVSCFKSFLSSSYHRRELILQSHCVSFEKWISFLKREKKIRRRNKTMICAESCFCFGYLFSLIVGHNFTISLWASTFTDLCVSNNGFLFAAFVCAGKEMAAGLSVGVEMVHKRKMSSVDWSVHGARCRCFVALLIVVECLLSILLWQNPCDFHIAQLLLMMTTIRLMFVWCSCCCCFILLLGLCFIGVV